LIGARLAVVDRCVSQQLQLLVRVRRRTCPLCAIATEVPTSASKAIVLINFRMMGH